MTKKKLWRPTGGRRIDRPRCWGYLITSCMVGILFAGQLPAHTNVKVTEETVRIEGPLGLKLGLRHASAAPPAPVDTRPAVIFIHGTNISESGNADYPFGGRSMMAALAENGLDVWALDLYGFGASDRYPEMAESPDSHPPLGQAEQAADQLAAAVRFLQHQRKIEQVMIIGDSGGSLVAGIYTTRNPALVSRLVLFGPITPFSGDAAPASLPAYRLATPTDLWARFTEWSVNAGPPAALDPAMYDRWAAAFLDSDPSSRTRNPPSVKIPNGPAADMAKVARGQFPYDPGQIRSPTLIVMGESDEVATFPGAQWLLSALRNAPHRRLVVIGHASHTIQFETERTQLYRVIADFLNEHE